MLCGPSLAAAALSTWYYAYIVAVTLAVYVAVRRWALRRDVVLKMLVRSGFVEAGAFALLALPVALPSLSM